MKRALAGLALPLLAGMLLMPAASGATETMGGATVRNVELTAITRGGDPVMLRSDVLAASDKEAHGLVERAAAALGLAPIAPSQVSAQWAPWPWQWSNSELPVPVAYNPGGAPVSVGPQVIVAGLNAWSSAPGSGFAYRYAGVTNNTASILDSGPDGENVISWAPLECSRGCVLALTSKLEGHEVDMLLNNNPDAATQLGVGTTVDWRTVILHELGHMAGLEHSCPAPFGPCTAAEADAVMFFQYRGIQRKLSADDIAGISAVYPADSAAPTPKASPAPEPRLVSLEPGWNFEVLPAGAPAATAGKLPCLAAVYGWDGRQWMAWIRQSPGGNTLSAIEPARSYWVWADAGCVGVF